MTTVLLIAPVTLVITNELKLPAFPFLFSEVLGSNIGGTATLIGDPPNILIGSATGLSFNAFIIHLTPVVLVVLAVQIGHRPPPLGAAPQDRAGGPSPRAGLPSRRCHHRHAASAQEPGRAGPGACSASPSARSWG